MKDPRYPFALDLGSEVGGYRIESVLGAGGFGITYRAYNEVTHKTVAIKEFYIRDISSRTGQTVVVDTDISEGTYEYALKKFQEEAQAIVVRFSHPNIIKGENFIRANNTCYVIMEYIEGASLDEWLSHRQQPPSEAEIRPLFERLFSAIDYVHSQNTMHRDITPRNIMIRRNGEPVLIDFGAAGHGIDRGRSSKMVAQMRYAPPEQTDENGSGIHGRYTDIFSVGGVLYRTVTGKVPVAPMTRLTRLARRGQGDGLDPHVPAAAAVADPSRYTPQFLAGIDHALELDEDRRPQSITELRASLGWAPAVEPAEHHADDATVAVTSPRRDHRFQDEGTSLLGGRDPALARPSRPGPGPEPGSSPVEPDRSSTGSIAPSGQPGGPTGFRPPVPTTPPPQPIVAAGAERTRAGTDGGRGDPGRGDTGRGETGRGETGFTLKTPVPAPEAGGGRKLLVAGVAAGLIGLGGIAVAWPTLMRTLGEVQGPRTVAPFTLSGAIDGRGVTLAGFAPSETARQAIAEAARRGAPDLRVENRLEIANGAPENFTERAAFAAERLGRLARGSIQLEGASVVIEGQAATPESWQILQREAAQPLPGGGAADLKLRPAVVAPYTFSAERRADGVTLAGHAPSPDQRVRLRQAVERAVPGAGVKDEVRIAEGEPAGFAEATALLLPRLGDLAEGRLFVSGSTVTIEGRARSAEAYERIAGLDTGGLPGSPRVTLAVQPPAVSPFEWSATYDGQSVVLRGYSPSREVRRDLLAAVNQAQTNTPVRDETQIADGAPAEFQRAARAVVDILPRLARGRVAISGDTVSIEGAARNPADFAALSRILSGALPSGWRVTQNAVNAPRISPYPLNVSLGSGVARITGFVPSEAVRRDVAGIVQAGLPSLKVTDETQLGDGAPEAFVPAVRAAVAQAGRLASGRVVLENGAITVEGTARSLDDLKPLRESPRSALPAGVSIARVAVVSRLDVPTQDCDRLALPADHPDKPGGEIGVDLAQIDAARAVPACQSALQTYPNVRRFATALGHALQKRGQHQDATREYRRAAEAEDPSALTLLAGAYREGLGVPQDYAQAFELYSRAAGLGSAAATHAVGWMFENGLGRPIDAVKAADWYGRASQLGFAESWTQLGWLAQNGLGRKVDYARAYEAYERGARAGSTLAMHQLGFMNQNGLGRAVDQARAFDWYSRAAQAGRAESMAVVAQYFLDGIGRPADVDRAAEWFERAAGSGSSVAMHQLGVINLEGIGRRADTPAAITWFERAAAIGRTESMFRLGMIHQNGIGIAQDYAKAFEWYQKGARSNDPGSIHQIGWLYENGLGRPVDFARAFDWYNRAAALGYAPSLHQIGWHYETGRGRPVDYGRAAEWYQRAADLGDGNAMNQLGWLAQNGFGRAKSDAEALSWYERAASAGSAAAMWNAALILDVGRSVAADGERAAGHLLGAFVRREPNTIDALSGDMSAFSDETRRAIQRILQRRGLYRGSVDGTYTADVRRAVFAYPGSLTN